jgi:hypothetical protein
MNAATSKNARRGLFNWLLKDWVWEVFLVLMVAPVVVDQFFSLGGPGIA